MRLISKLFITLNFIALQPCLADCPFIMDSSTATSVPGRPVFLTLPVTTFRVDADAPDGSVIGNITVSGAGHNDVYYDCRKQTLYTSGKILNTKGLTDLSNHKFAVGNTGVLIEPSVAVPGSAQKGYFPSAPNTIPPTPFIVYPPKTVFNVTLYKNGAQLRLSNPQGDLILPPTANFIHQWINSDTAGDNTPYTVALGGVTIISTPVCQTDSSVHDVPFGNVTETSLNNGIKRNLNFSLRCQTDFGTFNAIASITASKRTSDNKYIKVTDYAGNEDRLMIAISDSQNNQINVDGSSSESIDNITNNNAAEFKWSATLLRASTTQLPAVGDFTAQAEITFQIN